MFFHVLTSQEAISSQSIVSGHPDDTLVGELANASTIVGIVVWTIFDFKCSILSTKDVGSTKYPDNDGNFLNILAWFKSPGRNIDVEKQTVFRLFFACRRFGKVIIGLSLCDGSLDAIWSIAAVLNLAVV